MPNLTRSEVQSAITRAKGSGLPLAATVAPKSDGRVTGGRKAQRAGSVFQRVIQASLSRPYCPLVLTELPPCGARFIGRGKIIRLPMPCDLVGCVRASGRAFHADAKSLGDSYATFPLTNREMIEPHQIAHLVRMGQAGALSGLIVESKRIAQYLWLPWIFLSGRERLDWDDDCWNVLGDTTRLIDFEKINSVRVEIGAASAKGSK